MRIIHTYYPILKQKIDKDTLIQMSLSCLLAKKHYLSVELYCDEETAQIVRKIGLPYNKIHTNLFVGLNTKMFVVPKMLVYMDQKEPYIHIDLDTFVFDLHNIDFTQRIYGTYMEGSHKMINLYDSDIPFYKTYIKNTFEIQDKLEKKFTKHIKFFDIFNMSFFGGHQYEIISNATKYCMKIYEDNREYFEQDYYRNVVLEQLFISSAIRMITEEDPKYKPLLTGPVEYQIKFEFLFPYSPTFIDFEKEWFNYPFKIRSMDKIIEIKNEYDLFTNIDYDFNGFLHLNGYKEFQPLLFMLLHKMIFKFSEGPRIYRKINEIFPEKKEYNNLLNKYENFIKNKFNNNVF